MEEETEISYFVVWRKQNNSRREMAKYTSADAANQVAALLNKFSRMEPAANVFKSTYAVSEEKY